MSQSFSGATAIRSRTQPKDWWPYGHDVCYGHNARDWAQATHRQGRWYDYATEEEPTEVVTELAVREVRIDQKWAAPLVRVINQSQLDMKFLTWTNLV
eukprot:169500-Amphidinium_carterae.1